MDEKNEELEKYQKRLDVLLYSDSPDIFANYSQCHARRIIRTFFSAAEKSIVCLSGDFGAGVYSETEIENELREAVRRGVRVTVISLGTGDASRGHLRALKQELDEIGKNGRNGSFEYKLGVVRDPNAEVQHYMIVDGKRYRLETPHPVPVTDDVHAEVCCNGKVKAAVLARDFSDVWNRLSFPR